MPGSKNRDNPMIGFHSVVLAGDVGEWSYAIRKFSDGQYGPFFYDITSHKEGKHGPAKTEEEALACIDAFLKRKGLRRPKVQTSLFKEFL
jgi:hypothetical protein